MEDLRSLILRHLVGRQITAAHMAHLLGKDRKDVSAEMGKLHRERLVDGILDDKGFWIYESLSDPTALPTSTTGET